VAFREEFGDIVYKSTSGERSIVTSFTDADVERLSLLASAPVQFQEFVLGLDVRAHVVGSEVFATAVESEAVDYRYDTSGRTRMTPIQLPAEIAAECVAVTRRLGLELSGVDLRFADDGRVVCFEVNPSPAFIVYEDQTGQPIAAAIARRLA
jgi:glutathione synthase/RimK-type ligase-like ATP-grasp enzyme